MGKETDDQAEIEAAKERLKGFCRPASQVQDRHDPERWARMVEGREHAPRIVTWDEVGRGY